MKQRETDRKKNRKKRKQEKINGKKEIKQYEKILIKRDIIRKQNEENREMKQNQRNQKKTTQ